MSPSIGRQIDKSERGSGGLIMALVVGILLLVSAVGVLPDSAEAVPTVPGGRFVAQPDGSRLWVTYYGDEWESGYEVRGRYTVLRDKRNKWVYAKRTKAGTIAPSRISASRKPPRAIRPHVRPSVGLAARSARRTNRANVFSSVSMRSENSGRQPVLVILAQFNDMPSQGSTPEQWSNKLFGAKQSVSHFYSEASNKRLNLREARESSGTPDDGVVGWLSLPRNHPGFTEAQLVGDKSLKSTMFDNASTLANQAIRAANPFVDYGSYDTNANGIVSADELHVMIITAGGESSSHCGMKSMWGHKWSSDFSGIDKSQTDGVVVGASAEDWGAGYTMFGEMHCPGGGRPNHSATIGIIAHEMGHDLGLPDLYTTYDKCTNCETAVGSSSLMGSGSWNGIAKQGDSPSQLDPFSRWYEGWITPRTAKGEVSLAPSMSGDVILLGSNSNGVDWRFWDKSGFGEYFLLEYRPRTSYDEGLPSCGVAIWHVDEGRRFDSWANSRDVSDLGEGIRPGAILLDLEEADNQEGHASEAGDHFLSGSFGDDTAPSSGYYNGSRSGILVSSIDASCNSDKAKVVIGPKSGPDREPPQLEAPVLSMATPWARTINYRISATDNKGVTQMRPKVGTKWLPWRPYKTTGQFTVPADSYGRITFSIVVKDAAGNPSATRSATIERRRKDDDPKPPESAAVSLTLIQVDNNGNVRNGCGDATKPCTDVVRKFQATIGGNVVPKVDLLLKAFRQNDQTGAWEEIKGSPFKRYAIKGNRTIDMNPICAKAPAAPHDKCETLPTGLWKFKVQVPKDDPGKTKFAESGEQFLRIADPTPPEPAAVSLTLAQVDNNGNVRNNCGDGVKPACEDVVRKFQATIGGNIVPKVDLLLKAFKQNPETGAWEEKKGSPFKRYAIKGNRTIDMNPICAKAPAAPHSGCETLEPGLWKFKVQVPRDDDRSTEFASSGDQYLRIAPPPDPVKPDLALLQVDNNGNPRNDCGDETKPCTDIVRKFRATIGGTPIPKVDLLLKVWKQNDDSGAWEEIKGSPFKRYAIKGNRTIDMNPICAKAPAAPHSGCENLPNGLWRFQVQVPKDDDGSTLFSNSPGYQYLRIGDPPVTPTLSLTQVDNNGTVRNMCGDETQLPCTDVVRKFKVSIGGAVLPKVDLLLRAWQKQNGEWMEIKGNPFRRFKIDGRRSFELNPICARPPAAPHNGCEGLGDGIWKFQVSVPKDDDGSTTFAKSNEQFLQVDTKAPVISSASISHSGQDASVAFSLAASDGFGVTEMRFTVPGYAQGDWIPYLSSGRNVIPAGKWGTFALTYEVRDRNGNVSAPFVSNSVTRRAQIGITLNQISNTGAIRNGCGSSYEDRCDDVTRRLMATFSGPELPSGYLTLRAWYRANNTWNAFSGTSFRTYRVTGNQVIMAPICGVKNAESNCTQLADTHKGAWRFQVFMGQTETTLEATSEFQHINIPRATVP